MFEAVFLAQLEAEAGHFTIADSLKSVADKLVRRHPHVFARDTAKPALDSAGQVRTRWEEIKAQERAAGAADKPKTLLSGIAPALPALLRAYHIGTRAASVGFDWAGAGDVVDKIQEEVDELREVVDAGAAADRSRARGGGDGRPAVRDRQPVAESSASSPRRRCGRRTTSSRGASTAMESIGRRVRARTMKDMTLEELEQEWQQLKARCNQLK